MSYPILFGNMASTAAWEGSLVAISTFTSVGSDSITFSNIPQTYKDLYVSIYGRSTITYAGSSGMFGGFNSDYGGNTRYSWTAMYGNGTSATSGRATDQAGMWGTGTMPTDLNSAGMFGAITLHIPDYANTSKHKNVIFRSAADLNGGTGSSDLSVVTWRSTAAINTLFLTPAGAFSAGSVVTLYGLKAANS